MRIIPSRKLTIDQRLLSINSFAQRMYVHFLGEVAQRQNFSGAQAQSVVCGGWSLWGFGGFSKIFVSWNLRIKIGLDLFF